MAEQQAPESTGDKWQSGLKEATPYLTVGYQLAATMLVYVGLGYLADRWLDTAPTFLIAGSVMGMIAFFIQVVRLSNELTAKSKAKKASEEQKTDIQDDLTSS